MRLTCLQDVVFSSFLFNVHNYVLFAYRHDSDANLLDFLSPY